MKTACFPAPCTGTGKVVFVVVFFAFTVVVLGWDALATGASALIMAVAMDAVTKMAPRPAAAALSFFIGGRPSRGL